MSDLETHADWTWRDDAACADHPAPHWWTDRPQRRGRHRPNSDAVRAIRVCADCPVRPECLDYALATEPSANGWRHGIWGGLTPGDRQRLYTGQLQPDDIPALLADRVALPTDEEKEPWLQTA